MSLISIRASSVRLTFLLQRLHDFSGAEADSTEAFWRSLVAVSAAQEVKELAAKILQESEALVTAAARFSTVNERRAVFSTREQREFYSGTNDEEFLAFP
jgi:hypothetical protein